MLLHGTEMEDLPRKKNKCKIREIWRWGLESKEEM